MAGASLKKFMDLIWGEEEEDSDVQGYENENEIDEEEYVDQQETEHQSRGGFFTSRKSNVVAMPQQHQISMKIAKPTNFDQAGEIIAQLKAKNAVVMNLEYVSKDVARRIVDTVCGAVQALDGNMEKVSNSIFVVAPYNYDIINEASKEKIESKFAGNGWIK